MKPKVVLTSTDGWDCDYMEKIIVALRALGLGEPVMKSGCDWMGRSKIVITFKELAR